MKKNFKLLSVLLTSVLLMVSCTTIGPKDFDAEKTMEQPLGVMSAMDVELSYLLGQATIDSVVSIGGNDFNIGNWKVNQLLL